MATPTTLPQVAIVDVDRGELTVVRAPDPVGVETSWLSVPEAVSFQSEGRQTQCFYYPPAGSTTSTNGTTVGEADSERPPLIVMGHGGPTSHSDPSLNLKAQYWTSRGFAVADVNYGGSTGFGKEYRDRLHQQWGVVDVEDCVNAARELTKAGRVDGEQMAIRGSSSGGLTVLLALINHQPFAAGTSLYGVADLVSMISDTHKFESRYFDWLLGPYPEQKAVYDERSPINHTDRLATPMLVMQGSEDKVVPPSQSESVVEALRANEVPHVYELFVGESHGFRQADTVVRSLELELWFYGRVFGFEPADGVEDPVSAFALADRS